jgi:hypothetical protein
VAHRVREADPEADEQQAQADEPAAEPDVEEQVVGAGTSRTAIWTAVISLAWERPLLGWGHSAAISIFPYRPTGTGGSAGRSRKPAPAPG